MIKIITTDGGEDTKELWAKMKKEVDNSIIFEIEVEHEVATITDGLGVTVGKIDTGIFEIKVKCMKK